MIKFNQEELEAIRESLNQLILDGFPESDDDPIVTACKKVEQMLKESVSISHRDL